MIIDIEGFNQELRKRGIRMVCAESSTAGLLASSIASVSGASDVLVGSVVVYQPSLKCLVLHVSQQTLARYSAESMETTREMALGLKKIVPDAELWIAVTGVASPSTQRYVVTKPVGQVYVVVLYREQKYEFENVVPGADRNEIRTQMVEFILKKTLDIVCHSQNP